jgi:hypothetical protein
MLSSTFFGMIFLNGYPYHKGPSSVKNTATAQLNIDVGVSHFFENVLPPIRSLLSTFHHSRLFFQLSLLQFTDFWMCTAWNTYSPITLPLPLTTNIRI